MNIALVPSSKEVDINHFHEVASRSVEVQSHFELMTWLQGDFQYYLQHDMLIAAWGDFERGDITIDVITAIPGIRSKTSDIQTLAPLLRKLFIRWNQFGKKPYFMRAAARGFQIDNPHVDIALNEAMKSMRSASVHGINSQRGCHDCLYVSLCINKDIGTKHCNAMHMIIPFIDTALRQVKLLPHQTPDRSAVTETVEEEEEEDKGSGKLTKREVEVMRWIALGKTNPEIGQILAISGFTVKNHLQRIYKKLNVTNRAQAVGRIGQYVQFA